jgi:hypothetical protein
MTDQILQNTTDKIEIDIYYNNVLTNPSSVIIREIRNPNGTVILTNQTTVQGSTTGRYEYTLDQAYTATLGVYTAIWRFVIGSTTFEHTQYFEVVDAIRLGYVTPDDVRRITLYDEITEETPTDDVLQKYIDRSTQIIDTYLGGSINYAIYTEKIRCVLDKVHNGVHIQLRHRPIVDVTSVQLMQGPLTTVDLDVDYVRVNENAGYLEYFQNVSYPTLQICTFDPTGTPIIPVATVVYTAGYVSVPEPVQQAAVTLVEEMYKATKGDDKSLVAYTIGDTTERYGRTKNEEKALEELGLGGVSTVTKLLSPYRQPFMRFGFAGPLG